MKKFSKIIAVLVSLLTVFSLFTGCGSTGGSKKLTVWSHLTDPEVKEVDKVAQEWAKKNGYTVKVVADKSNMQAFLQAANSSKGPDIMYGIANDNLGTFQKANILDKVPKGTVDESKYSSKAALDACSFDGTRYALPLAQESIALFYNTDKVKDVPKTMEDLETMGKQVGFQFDVTNFYYDFAFIAGNGGYVFKDKGNGALDPTDIGLGNDGAKAAYKYLQDLVVTDKLMPADISGDIAKGNFKTKKIGLYIGGPWDVKDFKDAGVNFKVAALPTTNGKATPAFLGVQTAFVSATSKDKTGAWSLMKYLTSKTSLPLFKSGSRIPVLKSALNDNEFKSDTNYQYTEQFVEQAKNNIPMPNITQMQAVWTPGQNNVRLLVSGKSTPDKACQDVVKQVKDGIAQQK